MAKKIINAKVIYTHFMISYFTMLCLIMHEGGRMIRTSLAAVFFISLTGVSQAAQMYPDGSYGPDGDYSLRPDGTYGPGKSFQMYPDGTYGPEGEYSIKPDGTYGPGRGSYIRPDGSYGGTPAFEIAPDGTYIDKK